LFATVLFSFVASVGFLFTLNYDAQNHELKKRNKKSLNKTDTVMKIRSIRSAVRNGIYFTKILYKFVETVYIPE